MVHEENSDQDVKCIIHREALYVKTINFTLVKMGPVIKFVNLICLKGLKHCQFQAFSKTSTFRIW